MADFVPCDRLLLEGKLIIIDWDIKTKRPEPVKLDLPLF